MIFFSATYKGENSTEPDATTEPTLTYSFYFCSITFIDGIIKKEKKLLFQRIFNNFSA